MRKFLIHLLGGLTREECVKHNVEHYDLGCQNTAEMFKRFADQMHGMPADDWCKMMYDHITGYIKRLKTTTTVPGGSPSGENTEQQ